MRFKCGDIVLFKWSPAPPGSRDHTGLVAAVGKDDNGNVTSITVLEGNRGGGSIGCTASKVGIFTYTPGGGNDMYVISSFLSISEYMQKCGKPLGTRVGWMHYYSNDYDS